MPINPRDAWSSSDSDQARLRRRDPSFGGFHFPKGAPVGIAPIHTHPMPSLWTKPHHFEPERFAPEGYRMRYQVVPIAKPRDGLPIELRRLCRGAHRVACAAVATNRTCGIR